MSRLFRMLQTRPSVNFEYLLNHNLDLTHYLNLRHYLDLTKYLDLTHYLDLSDGYLEYHVNPHAHKKLDNTSFCFMIENDSVDPKKVVLEFALKDPIKAASLLEIKLDAEGTKIVGMDLDGDIVELK